MKLRFDPHGNAKQEEAAMAWMDPTVTDIYYGGAKGGAKSFTGVNLIFGDALTYPNTRYFIARKKLNDLRKFTIPTVSKVFDAWGVKAEKCLVFNGHDNFYQCHNGSKILLLEAALMPSDPLYERFGSMEFTRGWIEEAGEFDVAAKNNLAASIGRWKNDEYRLTRKLLQTGNPSKNYTYRDYYKPWRNDQLKPHQRFIQASIQDNKMIDKGYVEQLEQSLSKNEKERLLFGNWEYDDDPASLIQYDCILDIFNNNHVQGGEKKITVDVARLGGDKIVVIEWDGWRGRVKWYEKQTLDKTGSIIEQLRYTMGIGHSDVLVDEDGMGGGIVDFLKFKGFVNNSRAIPSPIGPMDSNNNPIPENFDNLKSQCYFRLAERINKKLLYLQCETEEVKQWIIEELEQVKQKALDSDMKKGVVPKDKIKELIGRSPDFADTIMMREYFELKPKRQWVSV
jgi:phage terminase large subunit